MANNPLATARLRLWVRIALVAQGLDVLTTLIAFSLGWHEGNPLMAHLGYGMFAVKVGIVGGILWYSLRRNYWWLVALVAIAGVYAAGINTVHLFAG